MKKEKKYDIINIVALILIAVIILLFVMNGKYLMGSTTDWFSEHVSIAEYFRTLFYKTRNLLPDLAMNIGGGQNIYYFSYYGFLSPIILFSYLLPFVKMIDYIQISSFVMVLTSVILMYFYFRSHNHPTKYSFVGALLFMCATPLLYHAHRHIMFINYMPFMVLGLFGVDKYFKKNKSWLLVLSVFLMIMTSYYYSISGIIALVIYGIYNYLKNTKKVTFKSFMQVGLKFLVPFIIAIMMSAILILPTFYVILHGRGATNTSISLLDLIIPKVNTTYILYNSYGLGLTSVSIMALIYTVFKKNKEDRFLGIILSLFIIFPILNYILNATMYIDAKILIPFLPLYIIVTLNFLESDFEKHSKFITLVFIVAVIIGCFSCYGYFWAFIIESAIVLIVYLLSKKTKKNFLLFLAIFLGLTSTIVVSKSDTLVPNDKIKNDNYTNMEAAIKYITDKEDDFVRINNMLNTYDNANSTFGINDYYHSNIYSSTYNKDYNSFFYDYMDNPIQNRNRVITSATANTPFLILTDNKYLVTTDDCLMGFDLDTSFGKVNVCVNNNVNSLGFATNKILSEEEFDKLEYPENINALSNYIVSSSKNSAYESSIKKEEINYDSFSYDNLEIEKKDDYYIITASDNAYMSYPLDDDMSNKLLFISMTQLKSQECSDGDLTLTINGVKNKLTCASWKYHNQNYDFVYTLSDKNHNKLDIRFSKGIFYIKDINLYSVDNINNTEFDNLVVDKKLTSGNDIVGKINVSNDNSILALSIPYDEGFKIYIDNKEETILKVDKSLIGVNINKGEHEIKLTYNSPYKNIAIIISLTGLVLYLGLIIYERRTNK